MKKQILFILIFLLSVSFVSSFNFDNEKSYDSELKEVIITNAFGFGDEIAKVRLITPQIYSVLRGENRKVAELEFSNYQKDYPNALQEVKFYDNRNGNKFDRTFSYKYYGIIGVQDKLIYEDVCVTETSENKSTRENCFSQIKDIIKEDKYDWIAFSSLEELPEGDIRIAIFTDVLPNDNVEWIPTFFGVEIDEFAVWTDSFNVGLVAYYNFSGAVENVNRQFNITNSKGTIVYNQTGCLIAECGQFFMNHSGRINNPYMNFTGNWTFNIWVSSSQADQSFFFFSRGSIGEYTSGGALGVDTPPNWFIQNSWNGTTIQPSTPTPLNNTWFMFTGRNYNGNTTVMINNVVKVIGSKGEMNSTNVTFSNITLGNNFDLLSDFKGRIDEIGYWNRSLSDDEVTDLFNSNLGISFINLLSSINVNLLNPLNATVSINTTYNFSAQIVPNIANVSNLTFYIWYTNGTIFNTSTISVFSNQTKSIGQILSIPIGTFLWNAFAVNVSNNIPSAFSLTNRTIQRKYFVENSQTFNNITTSGSKEYFLIDISFDNTVYSGITPKLVYNNTEITPIQMGSGNNLIFNASVIVPPVISQVNKTFYWKFTLSNSSATDFFNSTKYNQTINPFLVDNCTTNTQPLLNFTFFDEDARTTLNGTIEVDLEFFTVGTSTIIGTFNNSYTYVAGGVPARVCIVSTNTSYDFNYHARYFSNISLYPVEHKFAQTIRLTNDTIGQSVNLYNLLSSRSTLFIITLLSVDTSVISGAVVDIQREYVPINQFISVESPLTDGNGMTSGHFVAQDIYYNFIVTKNGVLLGTFNKQQVACQNLATLDCRIDLNLIESTADVIDFETYGNISVNYQWLQSLRTLYFTFLSTDTNSHLVAQNVSVLDNYGNNTICVNSITATSGTFSCVIPQTYGNVSILSDIYSDHIFLGSRSFSLGLTSNDILGGTKVVLGILGYTSLTLMFISNPIMIVVGSLLGLGFLSAFYILDGGGFLGGSLIFLWVIAGSIIIFGIGRKT